MSEFFIRRPIVAIVISIVMVIMGLFTLKGLSFEMYPFLAPPMIRVIGTYVGSFCSCSRTIGSDTGRTRSEWCRRHDLHEIVQYE